MAGVETTGGDFSISGSGTASVHSGELATALVRDSAAALSLIHEAVPSVAIEEISIDDCGRVVIDNEDFRRYVRDLIANPVGAVSQGICGYGCGSL